MGLAGSGIDFDCGCRVRCESYEQAQKACMPVAVAAAPVGKALPGAIEVVIGAKSLTLQPLNTIQQWALIKDGDNLAVFDPQAEMEKPEKERLKPTPLAVMRFDDKRRLQVQAEPDTQFLGTARRQHRGQQQPCASCCAG